MDRVEDAFQILVNHEDQHSLWPACADVPPGWARVGPIGDKATCLAWIEEHWTDIRPKSARSVPLESVD
jgi:uncharacterized protein YbdZ (MbtH family)